MPRNLWKIYIGLTKLDMVVLRTIERGMTRYEYVPLEYIERRLKGTPRAIISSIDKLNQMKLVKRRLGSTVGYTLTYWGLDILSLNNLVQRGVISVLGDRIGVGKEGNIYIAEDASGGLVIVKFHREGRRSFQKIKRYRGIVANLPRKSWFQIARLLGEREFKILVALREHDALVPEPIAWNRNSVVQEYIPGIELYRVRELPRDEAEKILDMIIETLRIAYKKVGIVHGDLSEYNVLISEDLVPYIIDWPQYVYKEEETADELLRRDVTYILSFFKRKYGAERDLEKTLSYIRGE